MSGIFLESGFFGDWGKRGQNKRIILINIKETTFKRKPQFLIF
jgi:hypothetical protein